MRTEEVFEILGIEPVKDETQIRNAYHKLLTNTNPEDDPEGFMRLRSAYEEAMAFCKRKEEESQADQEKEDDSPSGRWAAKAAVLYERLSSRCDVQEWKALFDEEVFLSLEENEECRKKLLIFLMNHFQLPKEIWLLFDKKLGICADSGRLKETFPAEFVNFLVQRCTEKDAFDYTLFEGEDESDYDAFFRYYRESLNALNEKDYEKAKQTAASADETGIRHPYMEIVKILLCRNAGQKEEAQKRLLQLNEEYPENTVILHHLADFYWGEEQKEEAFRCYRKLKDLDEENYTANYRLAFYYFEKEEYKEAKSCIRLVPHFHYDQELMKLLKDIHMHLEPELKRKWEEEGDPHSAMELAEGYYQEERYFAAAKVLSVAEEKIPQENQAEYLELLTRVFCGQAEYEKAIRSIECWEPLISGKETKKQVTASKLKISVYHSMGRGFARYFENAVAEYEKVKDSVEQDSNFLIEMAHVFLEMGEYQKCLDLAEILLERHQVTYAYVLMVKAYAKLWDAGGVIRCGLQCIQNFPDYAYPYEEMAKVYYDTHHKEELEKLLKQAAENKVESIYLDSCIYHGEEVPEDYPINIKLKDFDVHFYSKVSGTGKRRFYEKGYPEITQYLRMYPCNIILNKRGLFSMAAKEREAAMKDFQKILERDPADAFAHNNIGCLYKYDGEYEKALPFFKRAIYYMYRENKKEPVAIHYGNLAHTYELMGEYKLAAETYRIIYDEFNKNEETVRDLSADYARSGQIELAEKVIEAFRCEKEQKESLYYRAYRYADMPKRAEECVKNLKLLFTTAGYISRYYHMAAWSFLLRGQEKEAMQNMERAWKNFGNVFGRKKEKMDVALNRIFMLTFWKEKITASGFRPESAEETKEATGLASLLGKVFGGSKKKVSADTAVGNEASKEMAKAVRDLDAAIKQLSGNDPEEKEGSGLIATEVFFYKERYVKFVEFLFALYGQGNEAGEEALKAMEQSPGCRLCNQASCMRLTIARALLLEQKDQRQEAEDLYRKLLKEQPYNMYAKAKVAAWKRITEESI